MTVASLASYVGVSRALLAASVPRAGRRTADVVPHLVAHGAAADLLVRGEMTVANVAEQVGYGSPFTFSTTFKRTYGLSPKAYPTRRCGSWMPRRRVPMLRPHA